MKDLIKTTSWNPGTCKDCGDNVIICQGGPTHDYWWYCADKQCKNHNPGEKTFDTQWPKWVKSE